ncbi:hypothetical protein BGX34_005755 [Mortierella sp. NVP85]|nr:hypothetical protein BGX34_005755 [Mortierella sp. NVP85]
MRSLILSVGAVLLSSLVVQSHAQSCNGYAELCSKSYSKVAFPTTHNSYAFNPPGGLATNQGNDIPTQLKDGIRAFMLDTYIPPSKDPKEIQLCHTSCSLLDGGTLTKALGQIKSFLDENPNEVITIIYENGDNLKPAVFKSVYAAAGVEKYSYAHPAGNGAWPTLTQMISTGKRLVSFVDKGADASVPWLMAEFSYVFETPYNILKDQPYPCTIDRPKDQKRPLYVLNHFIQGQFGGDGQKISIPQPGAANKTNGPDLIAHINDCQTTFKQIPNFIAVDFYDRGTLLQTVANVNGVKWNGQQATPAKGSGTGTGSRSGSGSGGIDSGATDTWRNRDNKSILGALAVVAAAMLAF